MSQNIGKIFEENIKKSCPEWLFVYRPPDAAQAFENNNSKLRFSRHSPADYFWHNGKTGTLLIMECKTFQGSCSFERSKNETGVIHHYQIESLRKFSEYPKVVSGFLLDFRKSDNTYFLSIDDFLKMISKISKKSFSEKDMIEHCSPILIGKKKLKVNYRYDIEKLLLDVENKYNEKHEITEENE